MLLGLLLLIVGIGMLWSAGMKMTNPELIPTVHPVALWVALLTLLDRAFGTGVTITPRDTPVIDRSLDSARFRRVTGIVPPAWDAMVDAMAADATPYDALRAAR